MTAWQSELGHLFRRESGRLTSALTRRFGTHRLPLVEDAVNDALCRALETWKFSGPPENPSAWLMTAAKRRAIDVLRGERTVRELEPALARFVDSGDSSDAPADGDTVGDEELRMMFCACHARLPEETQVALILNLLGGFSVSEIAAAFFTGEAAMEKRLQRGKAVLAESKGLPEVTAARVVEHLGAVHGALYLLFNEGYHGANAIEAVREELCTEAIRLAMLLAESELTATPQTHALLAVMCLTAARLPARRDAAGELVTLAQQDRSRFDAELIRRGVRALEQSASGDELTAWHVEAAIAYEHAVAKSHAETNFASIAAHYDVLVRLRPSPVVALSRAIAIGEVEGPERALAEMARIGESERLADYPFYEAAIAEQHARAGRFEEAALHFEAALRVSRSPAERRFFEARIATLKKGTEAD